MTIWPTMLPVLDLFIIDTGSMPGMVGRLDVEDKTSVSTWLDAGFKRAGVTVKTLRWEYIHNLWNEIQTKFQNLHI